MPGPGVGTLGLEMSKCQLLPLRSSESKKQDGPVQRRSKGDCGSWAPQEADAETELSMQGALGSTCMAGTERKQDGQKEM